MKTLEKAFKCEHCPKLYQRESFCKLHEVHCHKNPINHHKCYGCKYLKFTKEEVDWDDYRSWRSQTKWFECAKKWVWLYTHRAEQKWIIVKYPHSFEWFVRMPLECSDFEQGYDESRKPDLN